MKSTVLAILLGVVVIGCGGTVDGGDPSLADNETGAESALQDPRYAAPAAPRFAYVTNYASRSVSILDLGTNTVTKTIVVGSMPYGVAVAPRGDFAYVSNSGDGTVSVIDTSTHSVVATIAAGITPRDLAVSPDGAAVYVTNLSDYSVTILNAATRQRSATLHVGSSPRGVAISPDGAFAYVAMYGLGTVAAIDTATHRIYRIWLGGGSLPTQISFRGDGAVAYVSDALTYSGTSRFWVIDVKNQVASRYLLGEGASQTGFALNRAGTAAYVANYQSGSISVLDDLAAPSWGPNVSVGGCPFAIAFDARTSLAYVPSACGAPQISIVDTTAKKVLKTVAGSPLPADKSYGIAIVSPPAMPAPAPELTATPDPSTTTE